MLIPGPGSVDVRHPDEQAECRILRARLLTTHAATNSPPGRALSSNPHPWLDEREAELLFMADDDQIRNRANKLLRARWQELLGPKTHVGRRARTLSAPIA